MNKSNTKADLVERYTSKPFPPMEKREGAQVKEKEAYKAFTEYSRPGRNARFKIVDGKGHSYGCGYAHLIGWLFTPPDLLTIFTTTHTYTLEGSGLEEIERVLMEEKVKEICQFNDSVHLPATDPKCLITYIDVKNRFEGEKKEE